MDTMDFSNAIATIQTNAIAMQLANIKGCQFVSLTYKTEVKMNKRNNPYYGRVTKIVTKSVQFNYDYENAVIRRASEANQMPTDFIAQSMTGAEWIPGYENKFCLSSKGIRVRFYNYENAPKSETYIIDGCNFASAEEIAEIKSFIPKKQPSKAQAAVGLTTHQVQPFAVYLDNILSITANGAEITAGQAVAKKGIK